MSADLTAKLAATVAAPAFDDAFDIHGALAELLAEIGMTADMSGGSIRFEGKDPIMPSAMRLATAAALGLVQQSIVAADLHRMRGGEGQDIAVNLAQALRRLAPSTEGKWELLDGLPPTGGDPRLFFLLNCHATADGREVLAANIYPKLKKQMLEVLGCDDDDGAIAAALALRTAEELEAAFEERGAVLAKVRTLEEFMTLPVYDYLASLPLIEIEKIGDSAPEPLAPGASQPLSGVRALGMGHVIAGAGVGRSLASMGADVLNLWRPAEFEWPAVSLTANVGMRSSVVDPCSAAGAAKIAELTRGADIFFANRRAGLLRSYDLDYHSAAAVRPGIIHVTISTHGDGGPWAQRPGFDQVAAAVSGMLTIEGTPEKGALPPTLIVNDYLVGWLAATGAMAALRRRATEGGSYRVHVSLTRAALWILSLGRFDKGYARSAAGSPGGHELIDPELFQAVTPLGHYQGVAESVHMSGTPRAFRTTLVPRGSSELEWLEYSDA